ncbi:MAG TPA: SAM-dependent methyltransferase [Dermatophilaceae bacterium]|nr:SAM-dependent methyltransferase [Dermatophilaceae bacterium]
MATVALVGVIGWPQAWHEALYGDVGFYRSVDGPAAHFTTATHSSLGAALAHALLVLVARDRLGHIVDIGCGRGELLGQLRALDPHVGLTGVDVVPRPPGLDPSIAWLESPGGAELPEELGPLDHTLVFAHEWLDVVPCEVAEVDSTGVLRRRLVDPETGVEEWGGGLAPDETAWVEAHWPAHSPGQRVEVGLRRDQAWAALLARLRSGIAIAVDYGHRKGERPDHGTLTAYREGAVVAPVPDGTCDLTAHVAMDSLDHDELVDQRTMLHSLGLSGHHPPRELASSDPAAYLRALTESSAVSALTARGSFGSFLWAVKRVG